MPQISIRIPQEIKSQLDFLSKIYNVDLSTLIRDILIPVGVIRKIAEQIETIETTEQMLVKLIVESEEFQQLLKELKKYEKEKDFCYGWECEEKRSYRVLFNVELEPYSEWEKYNRIEATKIAKINNKLYPAFLVECGVDNQTGSLHQYDYCIHTVRTLEELVLWLQQTVRSLSELRDEKLQSIANVLEKLKELVR